MSSVVDRSIGDPVARHVIIRPARVMLSVCPEHRRLSMNIWKKNRTEQGSIRKACTIVAKFQQKCHQSHTGEILKTITKSLLLLLFVYSTSDKTLMPYNRIYVGLGSFVGLSSSVGWTPAGLTYVFAKGVSDQVRNPLTPRNSLQ